MDINTLYQEHTIYFLMATISTSIYVIKLLLLLVGGDHLNDNVDSLTEGIASFKLWTLQAFLAFFMGIGWMGLATTVGWQLPVTISFAISFVFGAAMLLLDTFLTSKLRHLNSHHQENRQEWVGMIGTAYTNIPSKNNGFGQVTVVLNGKQKTMQASTQEKSIDAFQPIKIIRVDAVGHLIVERVASTES